MITVRCRLLARRVIPLSLLGLAACTGQPVSLTVQAGGTVVVPLTVEAKENGTVTLASYGVAHTRLDGTRIEDPQRGELILKLEDGDANPENDVELATRGVFVAEAPVETSARLFRTTLGRRLVLVADVPVDAPLGSHALTLVHRRVVDGVTVETQPLQASASGTPIDYFGEIKILPPSVPIQLPDGSTQAAVGTPTPELFYLSNGTTVPVSNGTALEKAMPRTAVAIAVTYDPAAAGTGQSTGYLKLAVDYPPGVIDVRDVVLAEPGQGRAWFEDDGEGHLTVYGVAFRKVAELGYGVGPFRVIFDLDDPEAAILDPEDVTVAVLAAADQLGQPVAPTAWGLTVQPVEVH